jgi:hypothetical protein
VYTPAPALSSKVQDVTKQVLPSWHASAPPEFPFVMVLRMNVQPTIVGALAQFAIPAPAAETVLSLNVQLVIVGPLWSLYIPPP